MLKLIRKSSAQNSHSTTVRTVNHKENGDKCENFWNRFSRSLPKVLLRAALLDWRLETLFEFHARNVVYSG